MYYLLVLLLLMVHFSLSIWIKEMENGYYEGDMIMTKDEISNIVNGTYGYGSMVGGRWPKGIVPYVIQTSIGPKGVNAINSAIQEYHKHTCLRFKKQTNERVFINFHKGGGCSSPVGYSPFRVNNVELGTSCWSMPTVLHEIGHSIGLYHEQSRPDRDDYVEILWDNIYPSFMKENFQKRKQSEVDSLNTPYDFSSMMHYGSNVYGMGKMTIKTKDPANQKLIDQRNGFSPIDIKQINLMYKTECGDLSPNTLPPISTSQPPPVHKCLNTKAQCVGWARTGYCNAVEETFKRIMKNDCCKACKEDAVCPNLDDGCDGWVKDGYCGSSSPHFKYMQENCRKACKFCS